MSSFGKEKVGQTKKWEPVLLVSQGLSQKGFCPRVQFFGIIPDFIGKRNDSKIYLAKPLVGFVVFRSAFVEWSVKLLKKVRSSVVFRPFERIYLHVAWMRWRYDFFGLGSRIINVSHKTFVKPVFWVKTAQTTTDYASVWISASLYGLKR